MIRHSAPPYCVSRGRLVYLDKPDAGKGYQGATVSYWIKLAEYFNVSVEVFI
jgi:hypothetical protein